MGFMLVLPFLVAMFFINFLAVMNRCHDGRKEFWSSCLRELAERRPLTVIVCVLGLPAMLAISIADLIDSWLWSPAIPLPELEGS